jgi:hypothetical protein
MSVVREIHSVLSQTTMLFFLLLGIWGIFRAIRKNSVDGSYMGAMVIGELLFVLQAVLGVILLIGGGRAGRPVVHIIYGSFALVALPSLFAFLKGDDSNRAQWYFGLLTFFLFGVALRATLVAA